MSANIALHWCEEYATAWSKETSECSRASLINSKVCTQYLMHAGAALGASEWPKVAMLVQEGGRTAPVELLQEGHGELKSMMSDLIIWLNAANVGL